MEDRQRMGGSTTAQHTGRCGRTVAVRIAVLLSAAAANVGAQSGTLTGRVAASDGTPVAEASVTIVGTQLATTAGSNGGFRIDLVPARKHTLAVRMIGYTPIELHFELVAGDSVHVLATLVPVPLAPLEVTADVPPTPTLRAFYERRSRGIGTFFTREDIVRLRARQISDLLRRVPGLQVRPMRSGFGNVSVQARGSNCSMLFYVDGVAFPLTADASINSYMNPNDIMGIEVYHGSSEIPAQFNSSIYSSRCGVVLIWTRVGPERKP